MAIVNTEFGTRSLLFVNGGRVTFTKTESETIVMIINDGEPVLMTDQEALCMIEFLALAARTGTGKPFIDAMADTSKMPALKTGDER